MKKDCKTCIKNDRKHSAADCLECINANKKMNNRLSALKRIKFYAMCYSANNKNIIDKCENDIKKELMILDLIDYALEHSTNSKFTLPNGKEYSCDMGYVEEFMNIIRNGGRK